ncbi:MAG: hypothetical protein ACTSR8_09030 [Promethearchaeota archaeon]
MQRILTNKKEQIMEDRNKYVEQLKKQAILLNHGRLIQILISIFADKKHLERLEKREGQEVQIDFPEYDVPVNSLTFVLSKSPSDPYLRTSENPKVTIIFKVCEENLIPLLSKVISTKYTLLGVLKLTFKYLLTGRIRYKPKWAVFSLFTVLRCFLVGSNEMILDNPLKKRG